MSKFGCKCGNVISDVISPNEVTGEILSNKSHESFFDDVAAIIKDCLEYSAQGKIEAWMNKHFSVYPKSLPLSEMLHDALHIRHCNLTLGLMECDKCGRLWIQRSVGENYYREYVPAAQDNARVLGLNERAADG